MIKLSIIVPVYNVERYVAKCLDSILVGNQFIGQVICVNDGSTDGSPAILAQYAKKYPNVEVITQENAGLSAARNSGIAVVQGEYVMFVDSDDYLEPNVLSSLVRKMDEEQLDVLRFNYQNVNEYNEVFQPYKSVKPYMDYRDEVTDGETFLNDRLGAACYAWQFILRRDLIYTSNIKHQTSGDNVLFTPGIYFEDTDWTPRMLSCAKRVTSVETIVYNYLWRKGSITLPTDPEKKRKVIEDKIALIRGFESHQAMAHNPQWFKWMEAVTVQSILSIIAFSARAERERYIAQLRQLNIFPLSYYRAKGTDKFKVHWENLSPVFFCQMIRFWSKEFRQSIAQIMYLFINVFRLWPHLLAYVCSKNRALINRDVQAYKQEYGKGSLLWFLTYNRSFRGLFYYRIGFASRLFRWLASEVRELTIPESVQIGEGLLLFHAYSTILNAHRIGSHCRILHMVTLGDKKGMVPTIGDNVTIHSGAVIVGGITIGNNCVIGPNAVVYKSIPDNCVVVGNPACILKRDGVVVKEKL